MLDRVFTLYKYLSYFCTLNRITEKICFQYHFLNISSVMKKAVLLFFLFFIINQISFSQQEDPVLFTVNENPVHVSEFLYIYQKNNGKKADFSKKSLEEYLDLYTKFKLKVIKARDMKLDTIPELITELAGYRKQLSKSYLVDKEVNEKLIREVYERKKKDLNVSHILILNEDETDVQKNTMAKAKIYYVYDKLQKGGSFEELAEEHSDDKGSAENGGNLGYVTAMLPNGFYEFENQIYNLTIGEYSKPFRTSYGYHIVKVNKERPARGEMEVAHILTKKQRKNEGFIDGKNMIDSLYTRILAGDDFEELARNHSMDTKTKSKGGYIGFFGINKFESDFEDAAFRLDVDGAISQPFTTSVGWHIVKRISKAPVDEFDRAKRTIESDISKDSRVEMAKKVLVKKIKDEAGFKEDRNSLQTLIDVLDKEFFSLYWEAPVGLSGHLFQLGDKSYELSDFANYCKSKRRERTRYNENAAFSPVVNILYETFIEETAMQYEEDMLEVKYPDFKALMREYDEGILLFEATKREVWDKASQDTLGLKTFYEGHKDNYLWKSRADLYTYTIHTDDENLTKKIYKFAQKKDHKALIENFNKENQIISFSRHKYELGNKELSGINWKSGALSDLILDDDKRTSQFKKIDDILSKSPKTLDEARGYVIADYQEFLEKNWVELLKKEFKIDLDKKVFKNLIK